MNCGPRKRSVQARRPRRSARGTGDSRFPVGRVDRFEAAARRSPQQQGEVGHSQRLREVRRGREGEEVAVEVVTAAVKETGALPGACVVARQSCRTIRFGIGP